MNINVAWLTTNRNCNLACNWCYAQDYFDIREQMDYKLAKKLIDISIKAGVKKIFLIGGEPTVYPELIGVINYIATYNVEVVIVTNGILLSDENFCQRIKQLNYSKIHFGISLKGATEEEYLENCNGMGFQSVLKGIGNCKKFDFFYSLSYVLTTENIDRIDLFAKRIAEAGIRQHISFQICNDVITREGNILENVEHPLKIDKIFSKKYELISCYLEDRFYLHQIFPLCQCKKEFLNKLISKNQVTTACHVHERNGVVFDVDGSLLLCNHLAGFSFGKYGVDFNDFDSFCLFWESEYVVNLHRKFTSMPSLECKECEQNTKCGGGCCIQWFSKDFDSFKEYNFSND